jgi:tripartite ATP-independent transporter DctM subunit
VAGVRGGESWPHRIAETIVAIALLAELAVVVADVVLRSLTGASILWTVEVSELALTILTFVGGAVAYRNGRHVSIRFLVQYLPEHSQRLASAVVEYLVLMVAIAVGISSVGMLGLSWDARTPVLGMRHTWLMAPMTAGMALLAYYAVLRLLERPWRTTVPLGLGFVAIGAILSLTRAGWAPWTQGAAALWPMAFLSGGAFLLGVPVAFVLMFASWMFLYASGAAPIVTLALTLRSGIGNFVLLAIPFFIFAGLIMDRGGIGVRIVDAIRAWIGHVRGGLLQVLIVGIYIVSGLSGSKSADMAAVGVPMLPSLRRAGYKPGEIVSVLAAAAVMGETIPPSIPLLVLGSITTLSIGALFLAGIVPAATIGVCLMLLVYVRARLSREKPGTAAPWRERFTKLTRAFVPFLMPLFLIGGILGGIGTATEVSSFAVVFGLVLAMLVYREMSWNSFWPALRETTSLTGMILLIIGSGSIFAWCLTVSQVPQALAALMEGLPRWTFLVSTVVMLVVMGAVLEGLPALLVLAPLLLPVAATLGIHPLQYGIVLIIGMGLGTFLPPLGVGLYVACALGNATMEEVYGPIAPYIVVLLIGLLIVAFVPWLTLVVPSMFHYAQ